MSARWAITALLVSVVAVGLMTALTYRSAAGGALASVGAVVLLALALGVAWASSKQEPRKRG